MKNFTIYFGLFGSFLILFIVLPLLVTLGKQAYEWEMLLATLKDDVVLDALKNSLLTSTATMLISLFFSVPLGYILARSEFKGKNLIQAIVDVPVVIPHSVVGIMLLVTFSEAILDNYLGIISAMLFVSAPFTINSSRDGFLGIDEKLEHVAQTLGASKFRAFLTISLPLALPSILSGAIMTWARAISEVGAILVVAYYPKTAQVLVIEYFINYGLKHAMPIASTLIVLSLIIFAFLRWLCARA